LAVWLVSKNIWHYLSAAAMFGAKVIILGQLRAGFVTGAVAVG
jgi:hypothetical protein